MTEEPKRKRPRRTAADYLAEAQKKIQYHEDRIEYHLAAITDIKREIKDRAARLIKEAEELSKV